MDQDVLSQDEIDALLTGVDSGDVDTEADDDIDDSTIRPYDLASQDRVVRGRLPTLEVIGERFARQLRSNLYGLLRYTVEVGVGGVQILKYGEYVHTLYVPSSINLLRLRQLIGYAMVVLDAKLVFTVVDQYFGGAGKQVKIEGRDFTPTESRIVHKLLELMMQDLAQAWQSVIEIDVEYIGTEVNPSLVNIVGANDVMVVQSFRLDLGGESGEIQIALPYSMLEPHRKMLDAPTQSDDDGRDRQFLPKLERRLLETEIALSSCIAQKDIRLKELMAIREGDVIPIDLGDVHTVRAGETPLFTAKLGESRGKLAFEVDELLELR